MELMVAAAMMAAIFVVSLWVIHKQTLHARDMQALFLQRQSFNFETQWKAWIQDSKYCNDTINNLAAWNTRLCQSNEQMAQMLQKMVQTSEHRLSLLITQHVSKSTSQILAAVGKTARNA